ncbi:MAG: fatty acid desaturase [Gammaproteobacteria bacterium]
MSDSVATDAGLRRRYLGWQQGLMNLGWLLAMHAALFAALWWLPAYLAVIVCVIHQRLLSEWFHEATHWNLLPDRGWNDRVADLLIGPFNGTRVRNNRPGHFRHHAAREYFVPADPDTAKAAATTRRDLWTGVLRDVTGQTALSAFLRASGGAAAGDAGARTAGRADGTTPAGGIDRAWFGGLALLHGAGFAATLAAGRWELYPLYFGALLTLYPLANRVRLYAQHAEIATDGSVRLNGSTASRTFHAGLLEQVLLHGPMIMYHHEHHARPALPYRALRVIAGRSPDPNITGHGGWRLTAALLGSLR